MGALEKIAEDLSIVKRQVSALLEEKDSVKELPEWIGTEKIALLLNTSPAMVYKNYNKYRSEGFPIGKNGKKLISSRTELKEFIKGYLKEKLK